MDIKNTYYNSHSYYLYSCCQKRSLSHTPLLLGRDGKTSWMKVIFVSTGALLELTAGVMAVGAAAAFYKAFREGGRSSTLLSDSFCMGCGAISLLASCFQAAKGFSDLLEHRQWVDAAYALENTLKNLPLKTPKIDEELLKVISIPGIVVLIRNYALDLRCVPEIFSQLKAPQNPEQLSRALFDDQTILRFQETSKEAADIRDRAMRGFDNQSHGNQVVQP